MDLQNATLAQLGHHVGLHVDVNLRGMTVGGVGCDEERWVSGVVWGLSGTGTYLTIRLDAPFGSGSSRGVLRTQVAGELISIDDPARVRPKELTEVIPGGVPEEIINLARAGKGLKAIKQYRALTGATYEEAQAWLRTV